MSQRLQSKASVLVVPVLVGFAVARVQRVDTSTGTDDFDVGRARCVRLDSGHDAHPLGTHGRVAYAVKTEDEQTLEVDADHEHRLYQPTSHHGRSVRHRKGKGRILI